MMVWKPGYFSNRPTSANNPTLTYPPVAADKVTALAAAIRPHL